jgi:hypothetical protein
MDYNTSRDHLVIREYGRHIQNLIMYARGIEDREERQRMVDGIIQLMGLLNPHLRNVADFKHLLWDHLFIIGGFDLDVDSPYEKPTSAIASPTPAEVPYPKQKIRFRHYGRNLQSMIDKARSFSDREERQGLTEVIVNFMKMAYHNWSNEEVSDDLIREDLKTLSEGTLVVDDDMNLEAFVKSPPVKPVTNSRGSRGNSGKSNNKRRSNSQQSQQRRPRR